MTDEKKDLADQLADYLLEFEADDFYHYDPEPDKNHIYFKAYAYQYGLESAKEMLKEAIKEFHQ